MSEKNWDNRITRTGSIDPEELLANPWNWRVHSSHQKSALDGTLSEVGWVQSIVVNETTGHIIDGHLRAKMAIDRGEKAVPVVYVALSEKEEKITLAAFDSIGALAETDHEMLDELIGDIGEVEDDDLQALLDSLLAINSEDEEEVEGAVDPDECPDAHNETVSQPGDLWILGEHRLLCGDSTSLDDVARLCDEQQVDMVWTDPPYNVDYQWQHEPILYGWKPGAAHKWYGEFNKKTVIDEQPEIKDMGKPELVNYIRELRNTLGGTVIREDKPKRCDSHPTMKPVALIVHMLKNSSQREDTVLDLCGGSGSTLIAAERTRRKARLMEIDPKYADVIVRRWQDYTGAPAVLEATGEPFDEIVPSLPAVVNA